MAASAEMPETAAATAMADTTAAPILRADIPVMQKKETIRVLQWNVLADCLATSDPRGFPDVPSTALNVENRHELQRQVVRELDADIVCLQEVDYEHTFVCGLADTHDTLYMERHDSSLGLFMAWRLSKVNLVRYTTASYDNSGQNMLIATFERKCDSGNDRRFVVATTHLKSVGVSPVPNDAHATNTRQFNEFVARLRNALSSDLSVSGVIVAADMNRRRNPPIITVKGKENALLSVYDLYKDTTYKRRGSGDKIESEDVLWSSFVWAASAPLAIPEEPYWPSDTWPSDHCVLCADFLL